MTNNRTMLKVEVLEHCITFRTISRNRKSNTFYLSKKELYDFMDNNHIITRDCYSFAQLYLNIFSDVLIITFFWLKGDDDNLSGYKECVAIRWEELMDIVGKGEGAEGNILTIDTDRRRKPKYVFKGKNLSKAVANKTIRHKLSKAMAYNFGWPDAATITFYDDFTPYSFYWREARRGGEAGMSGGLIFHNHDGDLSKAQYSVHT